MEIGSVLFDTKTKQIVKVLDEGQTTIDIPAATAAMSIDPLCEKYYWISPYVYCMNNPIKFIDPDGRKVKIANNAARAMENIAKIASTSLGGQVLSNLISKSETYNLNGVFWTSSSSYDPNGRDINYVKNPSYNEVPFDGGALTSMTAMGHEMMHGFDHSNNVFNSKNAEASKNAVEPRAVSFANYLREAFSLSPLRGKYGSIEGNFNQFSTGGNEKISNFSTLGNSKDKSSYGFGYTKTTIQDVFTVIGYPTGEKKTVTQNYYIIVSQDKDKNATYKIYTSEDEYKKATSNW